MFTLTQHDVQTVAFGVLNIYSIFSLLSQILKQSIFISRAYITPEQQVWHGKEKMPTF